MLWKVDRSTSPPQLLRVEAEELQYDPNRRRVLLFPGENLADHTGSFQGPAPYVGSIKYVEQTLRSSLEGETPVDIFLYTYEEPGKDFGAKSPHYAQQRNVISHYGRKAHNFALLPMILMPGERLSELSPHVLAERLSHVTMIGHSYGSIAMQDVANLMAFELRRHGWSEDTIAATMKEAVSISVASIARIDYPAPNFTQFFFTSGNDMTAINNICNQNPKPEDYVPMLRQCGYGRAADVFERHGGFVPGEQLLAEVRHDILLNRRMRDGQPLPRMLQVPSGYHIRSMLPDDEVRWVEERPDGTELLRILNADNAERVGVKVAHDYRTYLHGDHKLGDLLINVANNAVQRDVGIGDASKLLLTTDATRKQHAYKYLAHKKAHVSERAII